MAYQGHLYLASSSPRRYELLTLLNFRFDKLTINVPEQQLANETPQDYVRRLARTKAQAGVVVAMSNHLADCPVLGADTIVVLGQQVLEKPADAEQARLMLQQLSGQTHQVMTAIAFADRHKVSERLVTTDVTFRELTQQDIQDYIASGEPMDKAGSYGIQGYGGSFVRSINGSYHAVVGLPLVETQELLDTFINENE